MVEESKDAAGEPVITPKGRHRPEHMAADVPDSVDVPKGVKSIEEGRVTPTNEEEAATTVEGGGSQTGQVSPGPGGTR